MNNPTPINSVPQSTYLRGMTDEQIRSGIAARRSEYVSRIFPGKQVKAESLEAALDQAGAAFEVAKRPLVTDVEMQPDGSVTMREVTTHVSTYRTDTRDSLGVVGPDYGVVQYSQAFEALGILARRGDVEICSVQEIDNGAKLRIGALIGETVMPSASGAPNTLGHFALFEAGHTGNESVTAALYTVRLECFNGMTSREVVHTHKLRHTSKADERMGEYTAELLTKLLGDVETEREIFASLTRKAMDRREFETFATDLLGGELEEDASKSRKTRRENEVEELLGYFNGGNEGAGATAWGAYNSVTRWLEAKREKLDDAKKAAKKFESNVSGDGQKKAAKALKMLTRW